MISRKIRIFHNYCYCNFKILIERNIDFTIYKKALPFLIYYVTLNKTKRK